MGVEAQGPQSRASAGVSESALSRTLAGADPAADVNALEAAGVGAGIGLICFGSLRMIRTAASPATGH
ncbi:MAG: hypothetical protein QOF69_1804, partial [Solirubrobacteraceae bacterium]|nr:hypothetical protein [Solirubrobacteraceae bacterium]